MKRDILENISNLIDCLDTAIASSLLDLPIKCQDSSFHWSRFLIASSSKFMQETMENNDDFCLIMPGFSSQEVFSTLKNMLLNCDPLVINQDLISMLGIEKESLAISNSEKPSETKNTLKCNKPGCNAVFQRKRHLERHLANHEKGTHLICDLCGKVFHHKDNLELHMRYHEDLSTRYTCNDCSQQFDGRRALQVHIDEHHTPPINCPVCQKGIKKRLLLRHLRSQHVSADLKKSSLKKILTSLNINENFEDKQSKSTKRAAKDASENETNAIDALIESQTKRVKCHHCPKTFANAYIAKYHVDKVHMKIRGNTTLSCSVCEKKFVGPPSRLSRHMREVHAENRFECSVCGHFFPVKASLERHMTTVHHPTKYECPFCAVQVVHISAHLITAHGLPSTEARNLSSELSGKSAARTSLPFNPDGDID